VVLSLAASGVSAPASSWVTIAAACGKGVDGYKVNV
jgi:hypothetical protein